MQTARHLTNSSISLTMTSHRAGAGLVTSSLGASAALFCRSSASKPQSDTAFSSSLTVAALASKTTCAAVQDALTSVSRQSATAASSCLPCCQAARRSASPLRKAHRKSYLEKQTRAGRRSQDHAQSSLGNACGCCCRILTSAPGRTHPSFHRIPRPRHTSALQPPAAVPWP